MKIKYFVTCLLLSIVFKVNSQVRVGDFRIGNFKFRKLDKKQLKIFKKNKTTFVLPDFYSKKEYKKVLDSVWKITPYEIIYKKNYDISKLKLGNCLAEFKYKKVKKQNSKSGFDYEFDYHVLDFVLIGKHRRGLKFERLATIYFTPKKSIIGAPKEVSDLVNFRLGYLKNYIQFVNFSLEKEKSFDLYEDYIDKDELRKLKESGLFITGNISKSWLEKYYTYKVKTIDYKDLENSVLIGKQKIYYLMVSQINSKTVFSVINSINGNIIYQNYSTLSSRINRKDFKKLSKAIKKIN